MSAPYYSDDLVTLYHGDSLAHPEWWTGADILVTDPPYGMCFRSNSRKVRLDAISGDGDTTVRDRAVAAWGSARPGLVFGTWKVPAPAGEVQRLIWHKAANVGMGNLSVPWGTNFEQVHVLGGGWDVSKVPVKRAGAVITTRGVVGTVNGDESRFGHPTPKPVALMETLIVACPPGVVADPFAGVGSTLIAARNLGRHVIGVELEERYCEMASRRLAQGALDLGGAA